jgi:hydrogenase nickel incorporation protein HypB
VTHAEGNRRIDVVTNILEANDRVAEQNRRLLSSSAVCAIDIMGSPGAGKTKLLEATLPAILEDTRVGVITGDIETTLDAERIAALGVPVVQATTGAFGGSCHLDASAVRQSLEKLNIEELDLVFVENVGNLVCPAEFDVGQNARVVVLSIAEGEDKPLKYPLAFKKADLVVVSKTDLAPHLDFDMDELRRILRMVNPRYLELSARSGEGLRPWREWVSRTMRSA